MAVCGDAVTAVSESSYLVNDCIILGIVGAEPA